MKLYDVALSGNCHKARLMLSMLGLEYETVPVNFIAGEHRSSDYLKINPLAQVPALVDGDLTLRDSHAILVYLAHRYGGEAWLPTAPAEMARVIQWLFTAATEIQHGPGAARLAVRFNVETVLDSAQGVARKILRFMEDHLMGWEWLELERPTIADVACYPYVALAPEGDVSLQPYPAVRAWIHRVEQLPGYVAMPGLPYRH